MVTHRLSHIRHLAAMRDPLVISHCNEQVSSMISHSSCVCLLITLKISSQWSNTSRERDMEYNYTADMRIKGNSSSQFGVQVEDGY